MTRIEHRESLEKALIDSLPCIDDLAKASVLRAVSRSYAPNIAALSKAKAEIMRCRSVGCNCTTWFANGVEHQPIARLSRLAKVIAFIRKARGRND